MSDQHDHADKTEKPTPQKIKKARQKGNIPRSRDLSSLIILFVGWAFFSLMGYKCFYTLKEIFIHGLNFNVYKIDDDKVICQAISESAQLIVKSILPGILIFFSASLCSSLFIGGFSLNIKRIKIDFKKISPMSGVKRIISKSVYLDIFKTTTKILLISSMIITCFFSIQGSMLHLMKLSIQTALYHSLKITLHNILMCIIFIIPVCGYDIFHQLRQHLTKLKMSPREIKDEMKQQEGDPLIKNRIRQIQLSASQRRMIANIHKAQVIVNNPTHFSVALHYEAKSHAIPTVLAKGRGEMAQRIREKASEYQIPMLEAPALARALYRHCDQGAPIPVALYNAVAQVLAWVYSLKRWHHYGGIKPQHPQNLPVPSKMDHQPRE